ncbi:MAG: hypothetical protein ACTHOJ_03675 [Sphingomonas oligoaromativorans]
MSIGIGYRMGAAAWLAMPAAAPAGPLSLVPRRPADLFDHIGLSIDYRLSWSRANG